MKILHLIYTHGISGAEKHLLNLLPGLKQNGIDCELIIVCPPKFEDNLTEFASEFHKKNVHARVISSKKNISFDLLNTINKYLKQHKINIVHSHLLRSDIIVSLIKQFFNKKLFLISTKHGYQEKVLLDYMHTNNKITKNLFYYLSLYSIKKSNANIAVSKYMSDFFVNYKLAKEHFRVVLHGIHIPEELYSKKRNENLEIIMVGRLEPLKGQAYVIMAFPSILKQFPECILTIVGDGSHTPKLKLLVNDLKLQKNVSFLGFQKNPYELIYGADLMIIPSLAEPFGLVFIEAMALNTALIAFDVPAGNEILKNEDTGYLVTAKNINQLTEKSIVLLSNVNERLRISKNAKEEYLNKYTIEKMVDETVKFYFHTIYN